MKNKIFVSLMERTKMNNRIFFSIIFAITLGATAAAQTSKLSPDLQKLTASQTTNVVIQYFTPPTAAEANLAQSVGAGNGKALGLIKGISYNMSPVAASKLLSLDPNIKYISVDRALNMASDSVMV